MGYRKLFEESTAGFVCFSFLLQRAPLNQKEQFINVGRPNNSIGSVLQRKVVIYFWNQVARG